jgi:hypothetical protein
MKIAVRHVAARRRADNSDPACQAADREGRQRNDAACLSGISERGWFAAMRFSIF